MAVVEFALDQGAKHRLQVHLPTGPAAPVTVLLNRSILGALTSEEQVVGKDFSLPDNSTIRVQIVSGQPQVSRAGYFLNPLDAAVANKPDLSPAAQALDRNKKLGGCLVAWLILNLLLTGGLTIIYFLAMFGVMAEGRPPLVFLLFGLLGLIGMVGIALIFAWKKLGFYLAAAYVVLSFLASIPLGALDIRSFIPLLSIVILYMYLNRSGIWEKMS